jgi:hypothetical protein
MCSTVGFAFINEPLNTMTSKSTSYLNSSLFSPGLTSFGAREGNPALLGETEVSRGQLQMDMRSALGDLSSSTPELPQSVGETNLEPDHLSLVMVLVATVAGVILVICTGF